VINTTVNDYTLIVTEDISLNGELTASGNVSLNGDLYVNKTITVSGDILPTHHLSSDIGSAQKSFRDIYMSNGTMYNVDSTGNTNSMSTNEGIITVTYIDNADPDNPITTENIQIGSINNKTGLGGLASSDASFTLDIQGDLRVSQDVSLNSTLQVGKATLLNSTLNVVGDSLVNVLNVNDILTVSDAATLSSTLNVIGDASFNSGLTVGGKLSHTGLIITSGNEIDQIKTISQSLSLISDTWTDTNISGNILASGIYLLSVAVNDNTTGGTHYNETYTGTLSWYSGTTNSNNSDEIQLHRSGENPGTGTIYLRTTRTLSSGSLKLQIYSDKNITNYSYEFKFRRFM
jgi:hypothetical protein